MATAVWVSGRFEESGAARVSAFDAGLQHGVGLFETMHARGGVVFRLHEHLDRLRRSALALGLSETLRTNPLGEAVRRVVERAGVPRARVRLTITPGEASMLRAARGESAESAALPEPTVLIAAQPATEHPEEMFERGVMATIAGARLNPFDPAEGHKTLNYWTRLRELRGAGLKGGGEALFLQVTNHLAGGAVSNLFVVRGGEVLTPIARGEEADVAAGVSAGGASASDGPRAEPTGVRVMPSPVLPGITRAAVIDLALAEGMPVQRRMLGIADVLDAEEAFLTNSGWGVLPVVRVEGKEIGSGAPGPATQRLRAALESLIQRECAGGG